MAGPGNTPPWLTSLLLIMSMVSGTTGQAIASPDLFSEVTQEMQFYMYLLDVDSVEAGQILETGGTGGTDAAKMTLESVLREIIGEGSLKEAIFSSTSNECMMVGVTWLDGNPEALKRWQEQGEIFEISVFDHTTRVSFTGCGASTVIIFHLYMSGMSWSDRMVDTRSTEYQQVKDLVVAALADLGGEYRQLQLADNYGCINIYIEWTTANPSQFLSLISSISETGISDGTMRYGVALQPCQPGDAELAECPPVSPYQAGICIMDCDDSDPNMKCPANHKCCSNGCGKVCVRVNYKVKMVAAVVINTEVNKTLEDKNSALFRVMREAIDYQMRSYFTTVAATDLLQVKGTYLHGTNYATMIVEAYMTEDHPHSDLEQGIRAMEGLELQIAGATWGILTATFASHSAMDMEKCGNIECHGFCKQLISGETYCSCSDGQSAPFCSSFNCQKDESQVTSMDQSYCMHGQCEFSDYDKNYHCGCSPGYYGHLCDVNVCNSTVHDVCSNGGTCLGRVEEGLLCQCKDGWSGIFCEQASLDDTTMSTCEKERRLMEFVHDQMRSTVMSPKLKYFMTTILKRMELDYYSVPHCWNETSPLGGKYHSTCYFDLNREGRLAFCECLDDRRLANGYVYFGQEDCRAFSGSDSVKHFYFFLTGVKWSDSMADQSSTYRQSILNQMLGILSPMGASVSDVKLSKTVEGCVEVDVWYYASDELHQSSVYWMVKSTGLTLDGQSLSLSETGCTEDGSEGSRLSFQFYVTYGKHVDNSVSQVGSSSYMKVLRAVEMAFSDLGGHLMEMELALVFDCVFAHVEWNTELPSAIVAIMPEVIKSGLEIDGKKYKVREEACESTDEELSLVTLHFYIMYGSTPDNRIVDHSSPIYNDIQDAVKMEFSPLGGKIRQLELAVENGCIMVHIEWEAEKPEAVIDVMGRIVSYGLMVSDIKYKVSEDACQFVDLDACPSVDMESELMAINCGTFCSSDADCMGADDSKCCQDSCGATSCIEVGYYDKLDVLAVVQQDWDASLADEESTTSQLTKSLVEYALDSEMRNHEIPGYKSVKVRRFYPHIDTMDSSGNRGRRQVPELLGVDLVIKFTMAAPVGHMLRLKSSLMETGLMVQGIQMQLVHVQFGSEDDMCGHVTCSENSVCVERRGQGHMCACSEGLTGTSCHVPEYVGCDKMKCMNGGSCMTFPGGAYCHCPKGYQGLACEMKKEDEDHCQSGMPPLMTDTGEERQCRMEPCPYGFTCEAEAADRWTACCFNEAFLCQTNPCEAGGSCVGDIDSGVICSCPEGRGGILCEESTSDDLTKCEISQRFWDAVVGILSGFPSPITGLDIENLRTILGYLHKEWLPVDSCDDDGNHKLVTYSVHYMNLQSIMRICHTESGEKDDSCGAATCQLLENAVTPPENPCQNGGVCVGVVQGELCDCSSTGYHGFLCQHAGRSPEPETKCTLARDLANYALSVVNNQQETQQMRDALNQVLKIHGSSEETGVFVPSCDTNGNFEYRGCVLPRVTGQQTYCYCATLDGQMVGVQVTLGQPPDDCPLLRKDGSCPEEWGDECVKPHWWCDEQRKCAESERCMEVEASEGTRFECIPHDMDLPCEPKPCKNNPYAHCSPCGEHGTCYHKVVGGTSNMPHNNGDVSHFEDDLDKYDNGKDKDDHDGKDQNDMYADKEKEVGMALPVLDYMCLCNVGYTGKHCDQNTEICNTVPTTLCKHGCHGDIGQGLLCKCPKGMAGMLCNKPARSECEVRKALYDDAIAILSDELVIDGYDTEQMKELVRFITEMEGGEVIPRLNCTKDGLYAIIQCEYNIEWKYDYCRCSNQDGEMFSSNIEPYIDFDICKATGDPRELEHYLCDASPGMMGSFCLNGGACTMDVYNGHACECLEGFHGTFCEMHGDEKEVSRSLCEFMANAFKGLNQVLVGDAQATEEEKYAISNLTASFLFPMENFQYLKPECSEETGGFNSAAVCYYDLFSQTKGNCYCWGSHGPDISRPITGGDEPLAICYAPKECGDTIHEKCPKLHCEEGYRKDDDGCDKCECLHPCETIHCKSDERCQLAKDCHAKDEKMHMEGKHCAVCVPIHKPGICPDHNTVSAYGSVIGGPLGLMPDDEEGYDSGDDDDDDESMMDEEGYCPAKCRDDADCEGPMKCCGLCGSQCVQPLATYLCSDERAKMMEYAGFLKDAVRTLGEVNAGVSDAEHLTAPDKDMLQVLKRVASVPSVWIPGCEEDGYLFKPLQCDYSVEDLASSADLENLAPVKCFCVDRLGHRLNGTYGVDHKDPESCQTKAGECPYLTSSHRDEDDSVPMCSSDVDCLGADKCCGDGVRQMCTRPVPKPHMTLVDEIMSKLCMYNVSFCNGYRCDSDTWLETGQSCHCEDDPDVYGPFCGQKNEDWHPSTVCHHKQIARLVFERNFVHAESNPQGIVVVMEHYIKEMYELMPNTYDWEKQPLDMVVVECMPDGAFAPMQCVRDVRTWSEIACYCVDRDGHELVGTRRDVKDGKPECGEPDVVSCPKGYPLHHQDGSLLQCGKNTDHCPAGYACTMAAYGGQFCCLSSDGHTDVCQLPPDVGTECDDHSQSNAKTYYYFDGKECTSFAFKGCGGNKNAFTSMSACQAKCLKVAHYGSCPAELFHVNVMSSTEYPCEDMCTEDDECEDTHKCCRSTCGRRCFPAIDNLADIGQCRYGQPTQRCSSTGRVCPPDQTCYQGVCCRDVKQDTNLCSVAPPSNKVNDDCRGTRTRFFYNATSGMCEKFSFGGCRPEFNNFATEEQCCEACNGKGRCKIGLCPEIKQGSAGTCRNECERDGNCPGKKICCSNGCASVCVVPQAENPSDCWERHHAAQKRKDIASHSSECHLVDVPECDSRGYWSREQCHKAMGVCWCVTPRGHYVNNTMTHGHANCDDLTTYEISIADRLRVDPATAHFKVCSDPEAEVHCCAESLCDRSCIMNPRATCRINPCGGCQAEYFHDGVKVNCDRGLSQCETDLKMAAKVVQEQLITAQLMETDDDGGDDDVYNEETIEKDKLRQKAPRAIYPGLPIQCQLPPETGPCRGLARQWYYDPGLGRCDMFIWGMCQGNDNRFKSPAQCYHTCDQNADPCKDKACPYGQTCQHVFDKNCYWREKVCNVTAVCQASEPSYEIIGVYMPRCRANGEFTYKQCHDKFCWCVDAQGEYVNGLTTAGAHLTCGSEGATEDSVIELEECPNNEQPSVACIKECTQHVCPGQPKAHCKVDMCSDNCAVTFVDDEGVTVDCSNDVCDIFKFDEDEEEEECKAKKLECPYGGSPQHCPESLCQSSSASCAKNPCAVCHLDPCTCQPYFLDSITGERLTQDQCDFVSLGSCRAQTCMILNELEAARLSNITLGEDELIVPTCDEKGDYVATQCIMGDCICVDVYGVTVAPENDGSCKKIEKLVKMSMTLRYEADLNKLRAENKEGDFINAIKQKFISLGTNPANLKIGPLYVGSIKVDVEVDDNTDQSSGASSQNLDLLANNIRQAIDTGNFDLSVGGEAFTLDKTGWSLTQKTAANIGGTTTARPVDDDDDSGLTDTEIIIIAAVAGGVGLLVLAIICYCVCCKSRQKADPPRDDSFDHVRVAQPNKDNVYDKPSLYNPTFEEDGHYMKIRM